MAGSFQVNGENTTITFSYTAATDTVIEVVELCARRLYVDRHYENVYDQNGDLIPFESLTNNQKLAIFDHFLKDTVIKLANHKRADDAAEAAREAAEASELALN